MNLTVYNSAGEQVGKYEIDPSELSPKINKQLLHDAVVMYQANLRQGTFRTKNRGEVAGTTKKNVPPERNWKRPGWLKEKWCSSWRWAYICEASPRFWLENAAEGPAVGNSDGIGGEACR
jgi:hypothetical protein